MTDSWGWPFEGIDKQAMAVNTSAINFDPWNIIPDASPPPPPSVAAFPAPLTFDRSFLFGVATAPAHVEDQLSDAWLPFCKEPGNCHAWLTTPKADERLRFWTEPEVEIGLAAELGSGIFRMGVDWSRLAPDPPSAFSNTSTPACDSFCKQHEAMATLPPSPRPLEASPKPPDSCVCSGVQDKAALRRYAEIVNMAKAKGMKVVLTLFHHSLPVWVGKAGGWLHDGLVREFGLLSRDVAVGLGESIDYWLTMNEPMAFALFTYIEGTWPQALPQSSYVDVLLKAIENPDASIRAAVGNLASSHRLAYAQVSGDLDARCVDGRCGASNRLSGARVCGGPYPSQLITPCAPPCAPIDSPGAQAAWMAQASGWDCCSRSDPGTSNTDRHSCCRPLTGIHGFHNHGQDQGQTRLHRAQLLRQRDHFWSNHCPTS